MKSCWNIDPAQRLSFNHIVELIGEILGTEEVEVSLFFIKPQVPEYKVPLLPSEIQRAAKSKSRVCIFQMTNN